MIVQGKTFRGVVVAGRGFGAHVFVTQGKARVCRLHRLWCAIIES
jgi:hypothetical protein